MEKGKKVIVFCDDSPTARMVVKDELGGQGYLVYEASGPSELERMLTKNDQLRKSIDLFVLDLAMPEMIGKRNCPGETTTGDPKTGLGFRMTVITRLVLVKAGWR